SSDVCSSDPRPRMYDKPGEDDPIEALQIQRYMLEDNGYCSFEDAIYEEGTLDKLEQVTEKGSLGLDFIPVQIFPVNELIEESHGNSEIDDLRTLHNITNQLNEHAPDSLEFEMFPITAGLNAPHG